MPKGNEENKTRSIEEIMKDPALTEEEWRKELTEAYKQQYMEAPHIQKIVKQQEEMRKEIATATQGAADPQQLKKLVEELEKITEKQKKAEQQIDETIADLVDEDRKNRKDFAPEKKEPEKAADIAAPEQTMAEPEKTEITPEMRQEMMDKASERTQKLRDDHEMDPNRWMKEMHEAIEQEYLLQHQEEFDAQNDKTRDLTDRIRKLDKELKEGDDRKELEDLEKELGEHLDRMSKDRNTLASQVENMYANEVTKRREDLEKEQRELLKAGHDQTPEGEKLQGSIDKMKQSAADAEAYADALSSEADAPKPNIFESAFMKTFSGWLPDTIFSTLGTAFGRKGEVRVVYVHVEKDDTAKFFDSEDAVKPNGPDSLISIFKGSEQAKEKASEEILKTDKEADLNFDGIDEVANDQARKVTETQQAETEKENAERNAKSSKLTIREGQSLSVSSLKNVPHAEADAPEQEGPQQDAPKQDAPKKGFQPQIQQGPKFSVKEGQFVPVKVIEDIPHAEIEEPGKEEPKKEEPKKEEPKKEEPAKSEPEEELTNVEKAFKISRLFESIMGHDSRTHINSGAFKSMKDAMGKVHDMLGESFGNEFGSLMRDFGNIKSFQDLCKKGGPLDLAVGQALEEVGKKCEAYVNEKTENLTKTHMGSGLGNARLKDALDALSVVNPEKAKQMGEHIDIDVKDGKASKRMNYNKLNEMEHEQELKEMDEKKKARKEIVGAKKKEKEQKDRVLESQEEKSKRQGLHL